MTTQLVLSFYQATPLLEKQVSRLAGKPVENLVMSLSGDLNFQENVKQLHPSHEAHSFPAKFPPQLPRKFILELTDIGDVVLDPMMGSGTTLLESYLNGRQAIGFDIDPLAMLVAQTKVETFSDSELYAAGRRILKEAKKMVSLYSDLLIAQKEKRYGVKTLEFLDYWFTKEVN